MLWGAYVVYGLLGKSMCACARTWPLMMNNVFAMSKSARCGFVQCERQDLIKIIKDSLVIYAVGIHCGHVFINNSHVRRLHFPFFSRSICFSLFGKQLAAPICRRHRIIFMFSSRHVHKIQHKLTIQTHTKLPSSAKGERASTRRRWWWRRCWRWLCYRTRWWWCQFNLYLTTPSQIRDPISRHTKYINLITSGRYSWSANIVDAASPKTATDARVIDIFGADK